MSHKIFGMSFASIYPLYVAKVEKKGQTKAQLDQIIDWLTGYEENALASALDDKRDMETFFAQAPAMNPNRALIKGVVCGVRVEEIEDPLMREIRYLDKLVDELARGKKFENIFRGN
ncbi:MAG: DUF2200 domain-containing protein [Pseudomonadota bacterium]